MKRSIVVLIILSLLGLYGCQSKGSNVGRYVPFGEFHTVLDTRTGVVWIMPEDQIGMFIQDMYDGKKTKKIEWVQMTEPIPKEK